MADLTSSKIYGNLDVTRDINILNNLALDGYLSKNVKINLNSQNDFSTVFSSPHLKLTSDNYVNTTGTTSIALSTSILDNYGVSLMGLRYGTTGAPNFVLKIHNNSVSGIEAIRVIENGVVGINLTNPTVRLDVIDDSISEGFRVRHSNLTQGISIGYNTITANGTNPDQNISINCKGTGTLSVNTDINIPTGKLYKINGVALNVVAGNGLTGGGNLSPGSTLYVNFGSAAGTVCQGNDSRLSDARTPTSHTHGNMSNAGAIGTTANSVVITTTGGVLTTASRSGIDSRTAFPVTFGTTAGTVCQGNDSRLSDARTPTSHTHGNITNAGAIGTIADSVVITTTGGVLTTTSRSGIDTRTVYPTATNCSRSIIAGSGLTGGGALTADRTVTLGAPLSITTSSTNTVGATDHAHALDLSGRTLTAGNGLTGGGTLAADRTFTLGTPSSITSSSTNSVTTTSHTHAITGFSLDSHTHTSFSNLSITGTLSFGSTTRQMVNYYDTICGRGVQTHTLYDRVYKNFAWYKGGVHSDTKYDPGTGGSVLMTLDESCKLGIGTGSSIPSACLHVRHTGSAQSTYNAIQLDNPAATNNGNQVGILFFWNTINAARIAAVSQSSPSWASGLVFEVQNGTPYTLTEAMRINGAGNVGIGTTAPNEKLDIAGNVKIQEENSVKFAGTGASDSKYEICYNATDNSLCFNYIG